MEEKKEKYLTREKAIELLSFKNLDLSVERHAQISNLCRAKELKKLFRSKDMIDSVRMFFKKSLNVSQAAKALYLHRNTLIYRLKKIKNMLGLDLRNFEDAVLFNNLLEYENTYFCQLDVYQQ